MRGWMLAAAPFVAYGFYLVGSGEAERKIDYGNGRIGCYSAAQDAGVPKDKAGSACNCLRSKERSWARRNPGAELAGAMRQDFMDSCFAGALAPPRPLEDRSIVGKVFEAQRDDSGWGVDERLPEGTRWSE